MTSSKRHFKVMFSAGEVSGDMHAAQVARRLKVLAPNCAFFGLGGEGLKAEGMDLTVHLNQTAVMGFVEVLGSLRRIKAALNKLNQKMEQERPDALVLIDLPDFNFRLAKAAKKLNIPVIYYICPQVWAWRQHRVEFLRKYVDRRAVIFKFEEEFYKHKKLSVDFVGHPVFDDLPQFPPKEDIKSKFGLDPSKPLLTLMPGSRIGVASRLMGPVLGAARILCATRPDLRLAIPRADSLPAEDLVALISQAGPELLTSGRLKITDGGSRELLAASEAAILASGTSNVEAAAIGTPMVVTYKASQLSWAIATPLIKVKFASIVNLVAGREAVRELLQKNATAENLAKAAAPLIDGGLVRQAMLADLKWVTEQLGGPGAADRVAAIVLEEMMERPWPDEYSE